MLAISSSDGYISFVIFEENELGIAYKPEDINWDDEKFKKQYQLYFDVDIKKNVMSNAQNIITDIKIKKKKNINNNSNNNNNELNINNNINQDKDSNNLINENKEIKKEENNNNKDNNNIIQQEKNEDINNKENIEKEKDKMEKMEMEN
jgi:hypothetical protein